MDEECELITTEYRHEYIRKKLDPVEKCLQRDYFSERIEEGLLDPRTASIPQKLDEAAEKIVKDRLADIQRTMYQVTYKNPWRADPADEYETSTEDFGSALLSYIRKTYFDPHKEKVLAPPATSKRIFGYPRSKLLHASLSTYQDTYGRVGGDIMLENGKLLTGIQKAKNPDQNIPVTSDAL